MKLPGGDVLSSVSRDEVKYGAETGPLGSFRWFADFPVGVRMSS